MPLLPFLLSFLSTDSDRAPLILNILFLRYSSLLVTLISWTHFLLVLFLALYPLHSPYLLLPTQHIPFAKPWVFSHPKWLLTSLVEKPLFINVLFLLTKQNIYGHSLIPCHISKWPDGDHTVCISERYLSAVA